MKGQFVPSEATLRSKAARLAARLIFVTGIVAATLVSGVAATAAVNPLPPVPQAGLSVFPLRYTANLPGEVVMAANTSVRCEDTPGALGYDARCVTARTNRAYENNMFHMTYADVDSDPSTINSSSAALSIPPGTLVAWAGLYWGADVRKGWKVNGVCTGADAPNPSLLDTVRFQTPGDASYRTITASSVYYKTDYDNTCTDDSVDYIYNAFADVTAIVRASGAGSFTVADIQVGTGGNRHAGWGLVVVYEGPDILPHNVTIFDGITQVSSSARIGDFSVTGFKTPLAGPVTTKLDNARVRRRREEVAGRDASERHPDGWAERRRERLRQLL